MHYLKFAFILFSLVLSLCLSAVSEAADSDSAGYPALKADQARWIGQQIFKNECNQKISCLTAWNAGERFPSLGIGHFIWFQSNQVEPFQQSFPNLLRYFEKRSIRVPRWIVETNYASPWETREDFLHDFEGPRLIELREFLQAHIPEQIDFIVRRFEQSLSKIIAASPSHEKALIKENFIQVANSSIPYGLYSLIDYLNFKGEGISRPEQYNGQGWGLRQVLGNMTVENGEPLQQFVASARQVLAARVENAPSGRNELRWLPGWHNRLQTYLPVARF